MIVPCLTKMHNLVNGDWVDVVHIYVYNVTFVYVLIYIIMTSRKPQLLGLDAMVHKEGACGKLSRG